MELISFDSAYRNLLVLPCTFYTYDYTMNGKFPEAVTGASGPWSAETGTVKKKTVNIICSCVCSSLILSPCR